MDKQQVSIDPQLIRIGNTIHSYFSQLNREELTKEDFHSWIDSLEEPMKTAFAKKGLEDCRGVLNFQRFILELNDYGLWEFLKQALTEEDYNYWKAHNKPQQP